VKATGKVVLLFLLMIYEVTVQNVGDKDGSEVVVVYSKPPDGVSGAHAKQVIGLERVFAAAGKRTTR
jgi:beta-D-xylosidase 4